MFNVWHRSSRRAGLTATAAILGMALLAAPTHAQGQGQGKSDEKLPSAEALLAKMVKAMGGEASLRKLSHQKLSGTFEMPMMQVKAPMTVHAAAPNLRHVSVDGGEMGMFLNGFDGKVAWREDPQSGANVLDGVMRDQAILEADFFGPLNYQKNYKAIDMVGLADFNNAKCYQLTLTPREGDPETLYINVETNLIAGGEQVVITPQGEVEVRQIVEEYRDVDGIKVATKTRIIIDGYMEQIVNFTEVSHEKFDHKIFELPESIKALVKEKQTSGTP